jgi:hypothetical protein
MRSAATRWAGWPAMRRPDGAARDVAVPGPPGAGAAGGITLGVEEEFVLLDPSTGAAVPAGPDLVRMLDGEPGVEQELMRFQVEIATRVCTSLDDLSRELSRLRQLAADAAASLGCRLLDQVYPALSDRGDAQAITGLLLRLDQQGTGADRQRALFASAGSPPGFVEALARATLPGRAGQPGGAARSARDFPQAAGFVRRGLVIISLTGVAGPARQCLTSAIAAGDMTAARTRCSPPPRESGRSALRPSAEGSGACADGSLTRARPSC